MSSGDELAYLADLPGAADLATPAVLLDEEAVRHNISRTLAIVGSADSWRPHVKTARTGWTIDQLTAAGVTRFKAATIAELAALLARGARDVLLAYPSVGPMRDAAAALAGRYPGSRVSILVDAVETVAAEPPADRLSAFIDVDTGMHRTGIPASDRDAVLTLAAALLESGWRFAGIHAYDGHLKDQQPADRGLAVRQALGQLDALVHAIQETGIPVAELAVGSSHTFADVKAAGQAIASANRLTLGPGTVVYNDAASMARFAREAPPPGYRTAAGVLTRVISRGKDRITVDAGLSAIQVDAGRPHAVVAGYLELTVGIPSQEHLVIADPAGQLAIGQLLILLPRHIDTTLNQFDILYRVAADHTVRREEIIGRPRA